MPQHGAQTSNNRWSVIRVFFFGNDVVLPSWTLILLESWVESKTDFKGEIEGFKILEGRGGGGKEKIRRFLVFPTLVFSLAFQDGGKETTIGGANAFAPSLCMTDGQNTHDQIKRGRRSNRA